MKYLGFDLDSVSMTISLTETAKKVLDEPCDRTFGKYRVAIREFPRFLGKICSSLIAVTLDRLHF